MKRLALFALLLATAAQAQQRQPANVSTLPQSSPQEFDLLDNTGAWVPFGTSSGGMFNLFSNVNNQIYVLAYGVDVSGATDACPAFARAIAALPASGGKLILPPGEIRLNSACFLVTNKAVSIEGSGRGVTRIHCYGATGHCIDIEFTGTNFLPVTMRAFSIYAETVIAGDGIHVNYPNTLTPGGAVYLQDLTVGHQTNANTTNYFTNGIFCNTCINSYMSQINIRGANNFSGLGQIPAGNMNACIKVTGYSMAFNKKDINCTSANYGEYVSGDSETPQETHMNMIAVNYAWFFDDGTSGDPVNSVAGPPAPIITNSVTASFLSDIVIKGWTLGIISNNAFIHRIDGTTQPWISVDLRDGVWGGTTVGANGWLINGNLFQGGAVAGVTKTAIRMSSHTSGDGIKDNRFTQFANVFDFGGGTNPNIDVANNRAASITTGWAINLGACPSYNLSSWVNNWPTTTLGVVTTEAALQPGVVQPCVFPGITSGAANSVQGQTAFLTANTGAISVTSFTGGTVDQVITVVGNDGGLTTLVNGARFALKGATNVVLANGNAITLRFNGTLWRELARNF